MPNVIRLELVRREPSIQLRHELVALAERLAAVAGDASRLEIDACNKHLVLQCLVTAARSFQCASLALETAAIQAQTRSEVGRSVPGS